MDYYLKKFAEFASTKSGNIFREDQYSTLEYKLMQVCKQWELESIKDLYQYLEKKREEGDLSLEKVVISSITTHETSFFRSRSQLKMFEKNIVAQVNKGKKFFNIWCAGCSTGQECYTIGMILDRVKNKVQKDLRYRILGTDISEHVIEQAQTGAYDQISIQRGLQPLEMIEYFFQSEDERFPTWNIKSKIKKNLTFKVQNLLEPEMSQELFDFIFCRNVFIYFSEKQKSAILQSFHKSLNYSGYLLLGGTENVGDDHSLFVPTWDGSDCMNQKK